MEYEASEYEKSVEQFEKNSLDLLRRAEESAVEAARQWADYAINAIPVEMGLVRQVVTNALDFTEKVLKLQREFVERLVEAARAPTTKVTPKPATKPTHASRRPATTKAIKRAG